MLASLEIDSSRFTQSEAAFVLLRPSRSFFPHQSFQVCHMIEVVTWAAAALELQIVGVCGEKFFGGPSFRVSGARFLARKGVELNVIKALGRWGSAAVQRYVGDACSERTVNIAERISLFRFTLDKLVKSDVEETRVSEELSKHDAKVKQLELSTLWNERISQGRMVT
eukprot:5698936-Amphidinium_carterae.5